METQEDWEKVLADLGMAEDERFCRGAGQNDSLTYVGSGRVLERVESKELEVEEPTEIHSRGRKRRSVLERKRATIGRPIEETNWREQQTEQEADTKTEGLVERNRPVELTPPNKTYDG